MPLVAATRTGLVHLSDLAPSPLTATACEGTDVRCLAVDASDPALLYAGTQGDGILRSRDGGTTWEQAGLGGLCVKALATSAAAPGAVWAGTKPPRLFRSRDSGSAWDELTAFAEMRRPWWRQPAEKPHTAYVSTLAVCPADANVIIAGIEGFKLLRSADGGDTWTRLGRGVALDAHELAFHPGDPARVFLAAGFGASTSGDRGATWSKVRVGLDGRYGFCLAPANDVGSAYLAAAPMRRAHTSDARAQVYRLAGGAWEKCGGGLPSEFRQLPYAIATSPYEPDSVYVGLGNGVIWHSHDRGATWRALPVELDGLRRLAITRGGRRSM